MMLSFITLFCFVALAFASSPEENPDFFEGDIQLTREQKYAIDHDLDLGPLNTGRGASEKGRWPNGIVHYTISNKLGNQARHVISSAMAELQREVDCLKFKPRSGQRAYIEFVPGSGCSSMVGRTGRRQNINLAPGCWRHGIVLHEIGHALGFWHEQSRPDRDKYVTIKWNNISENMRYNFKKQTNSQVNSMGVPYDYGSIMHYGRTAFSKNGRDTIVPRGGATIGNRKGLSALDIKQLKRMYNCDGGGGGGGTQPPRPTSGTRPTRPTSGTRPTRPTSGTRPTRPTSGGCVDRKKSCSKWKSSGYCSSNSKYYRFMKNKCAKSCGFCGGGGGGGGGGNCKDVLPSECPGWKSNCSKPEWDNYMTKNCAKTCNRC